MLSQPSLITGIIFWAPKTIICPLVVWFLIYKFRRRHLSSFEVLDSFLQSDNKLAPISKYFPNWIYDHLNQGKDIHIGNADENDDGKIGRKMAIVALWCIQMCPDNRPSMNKVLDMLEGDVEHLRIPDYPSYMAGNEEESATTYSNASTSLLHDDNGSSIVIEIISNA
ncbi:hypothetical protein SASPL_149269 [Salvia splendens]|uniref:Uncharacterized protein n=1 Tax=Salvia splendens TaxID=180675 RepID=A0A8X8Z4V7_SALSN|nr:hypothetical protein SASPL_149269 [Salvia splendens]